MKYKKIFITISAIIVALIIVIIVQQNFKIKNPIAAIYHKNVCIERIDLNAVTQPYQFKVADENGNYNIIHVEKGKICILESNCPDKVCIKQGYISDTLAPIICLPNKLLIKIESKD